MKRALISLCPALLLAGCAASYDQTAVPDASHDLQVAMNRCEADQAAKDHRSYAEFAACQVAAERAFALAIHLQKMDVFETYAGRMQQLGADRDAQHLSLEETRTRAEAIRKDYWSACACNITGRRVARGPAGSWGPEPFFQGGPNAGGGGDPSISPETPSPFGQGGVHF
jgi:hypothetical protein